MTSPNKIKRCCQEKKMFRTATSDRMEAKNDVFLPGGDGGVCEKLVCKKAGMQKDGMQKSLLHPPARRFFRRHGVRDMASEVCGPTGVPAVRKHMVSQSGCGRYSSSTGFVRAGGVRIPVLLTVRSSRGFTTGPPHLYLPSYCS